jgi:hypothetical protein
LTPPTIQCAEHEPLKVFPRYPIGPQLLGHESLQSLQIRRAPTSDYARALGAAESDLDQLSRFSTAQTGWAVTVSGIYEDAAIKRKTTAKCLDDNRRRGIIF